MQNAKIKKFFDFFKKPIDKCSKVCYNVITVKVRNLKNLKGLDFMKIMTVENVVEMFKDCYFYIRWFHGTMDIKEKSYRDLNTTEYGIAGYEYNHIRNKRVYDFKVDIIHNSCTIVYINDGDEKKFPNDF